MGLFSDNSGGSHSDKGWKKAIKRFWNIFTRYTWKLLGSGALATLSSVVYIVGLRISIDTHAMLPMLIAGPLGGMLAAPQLCCMADTILRALRDDYGPWWQTYKMAWKQNVTGCLLPGFFGGALFGFQMFILGHLDRVNVDLFLLIAMALGVLLSTAIATWLLPQLALMELPLGRAILNAILLSVRHPIKTLAAVLIQVLYWGFLALSFPESLILFLLLNFWFPMVVALMILYDSLEDTFHTEEARDARSEED